MFRIAICHPGRHAYKYQVPSQWFIGKPSIILLFKLNFYFVFFRENSAKCNTASRTPIMFFTLLQIGQITQER